MDRIVRVASAGCAVVEEDVTPGRIVGEVAVFEIGAGRAGVRELAGEARERVSHDLATGLSHLAEAPASERRAEYGEAVNLLKQAVEREVIGFESMRRFADPNARKLLDSLVSDMRLTGNNHRGRIDEWFVALGEKKASVPLSEKEKALSAYKAQSNGELPDMVQTNLTTLSRLNTQVDLLDERENRLSDRRDQLARQLSEIDPGVNSADVGAAEMTRLRQQLAELKTKYKDKHPAVIQVREQMEALAQTL